MSAQLLRALEASGAVLSHEEALIGEPTKNQCGPKRTTSLEIRALDGVWSDATSALAASITEAATLCDVATMASDEAPWLQHVPTEQILAELARRAGATNYNPAPVTTRPQPTPRSRRRRATRSSARRSR